MRFEATAIADVVLIEPRVFSDDRGWFTESFNERSFREGLASLGLPAPAAFVQDNQSCSRRGVLRGLHYQLPPHAQGKLVRVVQGSVFDVAVDLRRGSPTFGRWVGAELSAMNHRQLWIPEGFAHGFVALEEDTHFLYKTTAFYDPASEAAIRFDDPEIGIAWPALDELIVNDKDRSAAALADAVCFEAPSPEA